MIYAIYAPARRLAEGDLEHAPGIIRCDARVAAQRHAREITRDLRAASWRYPAG
jgi:hypothetical protein